MSGINLINVSDKELIAEMKKRFIIIGFYNKDDIDVDGLDKYSYEEINKHLTTCDIDGDYHYQEIREALMEKFGDERESDEEEDCYCDMIGCKTCFPEPSEKEKERWKLNAIRHNMNDVIADIKYKTKLYDPIIITLNGADKFWGTYLEEGIAFCEAGVEVDTNYWKEGKKYSHELGHQVKKIIIKISGCKIEIK
jgi:hypothetical protein